jgi:hypothetical protein
MHDTAQRRYRLELLDRETHTARIISNLTCT